MRLYGMEYPFVRIGSDVSSLISCCIRSVRPGKLDSISGYCFISVSTSLRCSDVNVFEILTSRYDSGFLAVGKVQSSSGNSSLSSSSTDSIASADNNQMRQLISTLNILFQHICMIRTNDAIDVYLIVHPINHLNNFIWTFPLQEQFITVSRQ